MSPDGVTSDASPPSAPTVPGYQLGELLGRGAVGTVWAATRVVDGRRVAVKVVAVAGPDEAHVLAREVAVLGRVDVDGLVGFHEALGLDTEPPSVAMVLDHLGGGSLERAVKARGHLSVGESVTVLVPVARALAGLHALGVTHGDVTPANVLLELSGRPFLADLGVARLAGEAAGPQSGCLWGTEGFVAPEVTDEGTLTPAADVYAVGALAWWCVTGTAPEHGAVRRPLAEVVPGLPTAWAEATRQALLGDPALRPTAAELALAYFDSTPCEPLRMVVGADETTLLTQRLRRPSGPSPEPEPPARGRVAGAVRVRVVAALRGRAAAAGTLVGLVVVLGLGGLVAAGVVGAPGWLRLATSAPGQTTAAPTRAALTRAAPRTAAPTSGRAPTGRATGTVAGDARTADEATRDPAVDRAAPTRDPVGLMTALSSLRAAAMTSRSPSLVARLDAPGSEALAQDTALVAELSAAGTSWEGVRFVVGEAHAVAHGATTATVDAVVGTAAYRVVGGDGSKEARAAARGRPMRFALVWSDGRWRVDRVSAVAG